MYTRILVPLDGSQLAEQVLPFVRVIAQGMNARVEMLQVFEPSPYATSIAARTEFLREMVDVAREEKTAYMERTAESLRKYGLTVTTSVRITTKLDEGDVASYIIKEANKYPGTLIAMSTHGRSGLQDLLLGSIANKVVHIANTPVLIVRPREALREFLAFKTVIVPLDGSPLAEQVLPHVVSLVKSLHLGVLLVRVNTSIKDFYLYTGYALPGYEKHVAGMDVEAGRYLDSIAEKLKQQGLKSVEKRVLLGHAPDAIVDLAVGTPDNVVAMATHGRSGLGKWVMGSVTERVVSRCGDPVLVIRPEAKSAV